MTEHRRLKLLHIGPVDVVLAVPPRLYDRVASARVYRLVTALVGRILRVASRAEPRVGHVVGSVEAVPRARATLPRPEDVDPAARALLDRVAPLSWYHTIELGHGVVTPGFVDHRPQVVHYGLPDSLEGMRCLDVATFDGFWAFEMERRGAAEVVALDIDRVAETDIPKLILEEAIRLDPDKRTGAAFELAHELLGSNVRREVCNVYELDPQRFGEFDLVFVSDLLVHLRDPQLALERVFGVCRGSVVVGEPFDPTLEAFSDHALARFTGGLPSETWWFPNTATLKAMMGVAGFEPAVEVSRFILNAASAVPIHKIVLHGFVPERHSWRGLLEEEQARRQRAATAGGVTADVKDV